MAENTPIPLGGAVPPKPAEAAKVQPKKETVRINLPPKPTSAPTIKLPTLAPGSAPPSMATAAPAAAPTARTTPPPPPSSSSQVRGGPPPSAAAQRAAAHPSVAPRPIPAAAVGLTTMDMVLSLLATVATLAGLAAVLWLQYGMPDTPSL